MTVHNIEPGSATHEGVTAALDQVQAWADKSSNAADYGSRAVGCQVIDTHGRPILFSCNRVTITDKGQRIDTHAEVQAVAMIEQSKLKEAARGGAIALTLFPCQECLEELIAKLGPSKLITRAPAPEDRDKWYPGVYLDNLDSYPLEIILV